MGSSDDRVQDRLMAGCGCIQCSPVFMAPSAEASSLFSLLHPYWIPESPLKASKISARRPHLTEETELQSLLRGVPRLFSRFEVFYSVLVWGVLGLTPSSVFKDYS